MAESFSPGAIDLSSASALFGAGAPSSAFPKPSLLNPGAPLEDLLRQANEFLGTKGPDDTGMSPAVRAASTPQPGGSSAPILTGFTPAAVESPTAPTSLSASLGAPPSPPGIGQEPMPPAPSAFGGAPLSMPDAPSGGVSLGSMLSLLTEGTKLLRDFGGSAASSVPASSIPGSFDAMNALRAAKGASPFVSTFEDPRMPGVTFPTTTPLSGITTSTIPTTSEIVGQTPELAVGATDVGSAGTGLSSFMPYVQALLSVIGNAFSDKPPALQAIQDAMALAGAAAAPVTFGLSIPASRAAAAGAARGYRDIDQGNWGQLALEAATPIGAINDAASLFGVSDPMGFGPSSAWQSFGGRLGDTLRTEGDLTRWLAGQLAGATSAQDAATVIEQYKQLLGLDVGGYAIGSGPLEIPAPPGATGRKHEGGASADFGPIAETLQAYASMLPGPVSGTPFAAQPFRALDPARDAAPSGYAYYNPARSMTYGFDATGPWRYGGVPLGAGGTWGNADQNFPPIGYAGE